MKSTITKRYGLTFFINLFLIILVVFLVLFFIGTIKVYHTETFTPNMNNNNQLTPGKFPISDTQPLLYGSYNVKKNTNVTKNNDYNIWKQYPVYPSSYKQETNNKRDWTTPDNGTCSPAEFCGTPYEKTEQKKDIVSNPIPVDSKVTRINWWAANNCE
jgi:hypothetical protein